MGHFCSLYLSIVFLFSPQRLLTGLIQQLDSISILLFSFLLIDLRSIVINHPSIHPSIHSSSPFFHPNTICLQQQHRASTQDLSLPT
ncbi:uncharacterized protein BO80DRAFT_176472 [Aspergillus ibericus CBS 121593]|uniref:Uncharacterized protein n=1 Tax=Aspergillus ibericus CBS 121593 TaxID=1448316 RepID=A0A395HBS3_9EURO|nr:hypothetical protein BO80DRAFT_176472 [Aspergillus ibericus CBS 121593]RAL05086.1 hypothetical protein BO80DRAFT_176472 [Aspergillus ibericus CBS 121593]